jgi:hypothetical protein
MSFRNVYLKVQIAATVHGNILYWKKPHVPKKRHILYMEHRAGKAARLASWRKMTQPGEICWRWSMVALEGNRGNLVSAH